MTRHSSALSYSGMSIAANKFVTLSDPKGLFGAQNVVPLVYTAGVNPTITAALNAFSALREWNLALIGSTPAEAMSKIVTHPERGEMTFRVIVDTMAGHDINHLGQLDRIIAGFTPV